MKGDFSRSTFRRDKHYSNVRLQQGRVLLDADWNEQVDIQAYRDQTTTSDVVGTSGAPLYDAGFELSVEGEQLKIGRGRYYVDGILCKNDQMATSISVQPDLPGIDLPTEPGRYVAYLDVWERHITALEDPAIREVALGGSDTTTRTKTVWQVKLDKLKPEDPDPPQSGFESGWKPKHAEGTVGRLRAQAQQSGAPGDLDLGSAASGYRRLENQLYRVEIHDGCRPYGALLPSGSVPVTINPDHTHEVQVEDDRRVWQVGQLVELFSEESEVPGIQAVVTAVGATDETTRTLTFDKEVSTIEPEPTHLQTITFKWSRDNGTVVTGLEGIEGNVITVSDVGKDPVLGFAAGQWVEMSDEDRTLRGEPGVLGEIASVHGNDLTVRNWPNGTPPTDDDFERRARPTVRRWDSKGSILVTIPVSVEVWEDLEEEGVQVQFTAGTYRTGDYWTIPARSLNGSVEWPHDDTQDPCSVPPHGIEHHYGPLALLQLEDGGTWTILRDFRKLFLPFAEQFRLHVAGVFLQNPADTALNTRGQPLKPDGDVAATELKNGIILACKTTVDPDIVNENTCFVTLDIPFPLSDADQALWGTSVVGFQSLILMAEVSARSKDIVWEPSTETGKWLTDLFEKMKGRYDKSLQARLKLKGSPFERRFSVVPSVKRIGFIPNIKNRRFDERWREEMSDAISLAINRRGLIDALQVPGYVPKDDEFNPQTAALLIHTIRDKHNLPPFSSFEPLVAEERFEAAAKLVCEMLLAIPEGFALPFKASLPEGGLPLVEFVKDVCENTPERLGMIICDKDVEAKLVEQVPNNFAPGTFVEF